MILKLLCHWFVLAVSLIVTASAFAQPGLTVQDLDVQRQYWFKKAMEGDPEAQFVMGDSYLNGRMNVAKDGVRAVEWFLKAAAKGHADSQFELGKLYYFGLSGVAPNGQEAVRWLKSAEAQPSLKARHRAFSQMLLATCFTTGLGVAKDDAEAARWFRKAAESGDHLAEYRLGLCYLNGTGVPQNDREASFWFLKAANAGETDAQIKLADVYSSGRGVPQDYIAAYKWYNVAAAKGNDQAHRSREFLRSLMTPRQVAEAQRLSSDYYNRASTPSDPSGRVAPSMRLQ